MPISYVRWQSYPWKNELAQQADRVRIHWAELQSEVYDGEHSPMDMLDRALVLAAFAMRRMFEKRLVTDKLNAETIAVRIFKANAPPDFRPPYIGESGGNAFRNYDFECATVEITKITDVANEIIHSTQIMAVYGEETVLPGLLIASDWHQNSRLLHLTIEELNAIVGRVLSDFVKMTSDQRDPHTGKVKSIRLGLEEP